MKTRSFAALVSALVMYLSIGQSLARGISADQLRALTPKLEDGDLIFIRYSNPVFRRVAETTDSWETHVGVLFQSTNGEWQVAESKFPLSKFSSLRRFIARSEGGRYYISRRQGGLTAEEKARMRIAAEARMGIFYDLGFNYHSSKLYCSKFVREVYLEATGEPVGKLETFRQLLMDNPRAPLGFWRVWFFGRIPWQRICVTTTSELRSTQFVPVADSTQGG